MEPEPEPQISVEEVPPPAVETVHEAALRLIDDLNGLQALSPTPGEGLFIRQVVPGQEHVPLARSGAMTSKLDYVSVPVRSIDYVLAYEDFALAPGSALSPTEQLRNAFNAAMEAEELEVEEERVGKHVFVKIHCPIDRLCRAAEAVRIETPLAGLIVDEKKSNKQKGRLAKKLNKVLDMEEKGYEIYTPFLYKCREWFLGSQEPDNFFRSSIRCLLVHYILININIGKLVDSGGRHAAKIGLPFLLMRKAYTDAFIVHDPSAMEPSSLCPEALIQRSLVLSEASDDLDKSEAFKVIPDTRKILTERWVGFRKRQPLDLIKDYLGEKIGFYFGWVGTLVTSLWIPATLGVIVFIYGLVQRVTHDENYVGENNTRDATYYIEIIKASSDNHLTPAYAFIICLWGTIFSEVWKRKQTTLAHRWHMDTFDSVEPDRPQFEGTRNRPNPVTGEDYWYYPVTHRIFKYFTSTSVLIFMVFIVVISVTGVITYRVYSEMTWCVRGVIEVMNSTNVTKYDTRCRMIHGTIIPTVLNTVSIMLLGQIYQWVAIKLTDWENHRTWSNYNDALVIKLFAFQFVNTYASLFYIAFFRRDVFGRGYGILGMGPRYLDNCDSGRYDSCMSLLSFQLLSHMIIKPLPKFFMDIVYPWIKKSIKRFDPNRVSDGQFLNRQHFLLKEMQKPPAEDFRREELNEKVIQYGYVLMFGSSLPLAPLLALIMNIIDMRVDARRLLWWNRRPIPYRDNDIGMWSNILDFVNIVGVISNGLLLAFTSDFGRERSKEFQFTIIILFEHLVFAAKALLVIVIPDVPLSVSQEKKLSQQFVGFLMKKLSAVKTHLVNGYEEKVETNKEDIAMTNKNK